MDKYSPVINGVRLTIDNCFLSLSSYYNHWNDCFSYHSSKFILLTNLASLL